MTEDEAKQKWCPFVRVTIGPNDAAWQGNMLTNRAAIPADNTDTLCIGSDCMAWRWKAAIGRVASTGEAVPVYGYCGLAGESQ